MYVCVCMYNVNDLFIENLIIFKTMYLKNIYFVLHISHRVVLLLCFNFTIAAN